MRTQFLRVKLPGFTLIRTKFIFNIIRFVPRKYAKSVYETKTVSHLIIRYINGDYTKYIKM